MKTIYLAGGCFWGVQEYFSRVEGVKNTISGYANGNTENPTYEDVCTGITGFAETVKVDYDKDIVSLKYLLEKFFRIINPTLLNRQGGDIGNQYRTGIYYVDQEDLKIIESVFKEEEKKYEGKIVTEVMGLKNFYEAEDYHQDYLKKNPSGYCHVDMNA